MRIAIVSDIHGNRTAFEAVVADLAETSPDLILHGGDLAHGGSSPAHIIDHIRDLGWPGVLGNTDEMLPMPQSLTEFASHMPQLQSMWDAIAEMADATRVALGLDRLAWLAGLPLRQIHGPVALVHASPESVWRSPAADADAAELEPVYSPLGQPIAVYGHIHHPFVRNTPGVTVINSGSVSLSYDGDPRAAYLLLDDSTPTIRRVEYNVDREVKALAAARIPHADWIAKILETARPQMPV
ncbi:MAG TPA: metallophosphoesterase family protein [Bryobacteraceae bacterium]|nr:metallophosphoesterase family protein [Bryobacteraceae bacterium]